MTEVIKEEGLIKDSYELIIKEFQTLISVFYLLLVAIGMIFNYYKYAQFGINIFQYADAFDFLIAPFQDFTIILFALLSMLIPYAAVRFDIYFKKKKPETYSRYNYGLDKKSWFNAFRFLLLSSVFIYYLTIAGSAYGRYFKKRIEEQSTLTVAFQDTKSEEGKLIGKTQEIVFLYIDGGVTAIPINAGVKKIRIE